MIQLIIALWLALSPAHHNTTHGNGTHFTSFGDTGGETEHIPPPPPPPPPHQ